MEVLPRLCMNDSPRMILQLKRMNYHANDDILYCLMFVFSYSPASSWEDFEICDLEVTRIFLMFSRKQNKTAKLYSTEGLRVS